MGYGANVPFQSILQMEGNRIKNLRGTWREIQFLRHYFVIDILGGKFRIVP